MATTKTYRCDLCGDTRPTLARMRMHKAGKHRNPPEVPANFPKVFNGTASMLSANDLRNVANVLDILNMKLVARES